MPESLFGLVSLMGGLLGGVMGLSVVGLPVLPLSSVMAVPLPEPDPDKAASEMAPDASATERFDSGAAGEDVVWCSFVLKRA